jgi:hypothetical protein
VGSLGLVAARHARLAAAHNSFPIRSPFRLVPKPRSSQPIIALDPKLSLRMPMGAKLSFARRGCEPAAPPPRGLGTISGRMGPIPRPPGSIPFPAGSIPFGAGSIPFRAGSIPFRAGSIPFRAGSIPFGMGKASGCARNDTFPVFPVGKGLSRNEHCGELTNPADEPAIVAFYPPQRGEEKYSNRNLCCQINLFH